MKNEKDTKLENWLESLQRESWQLELLISGFTIFLLVQFADSIPDLFPAFHMHTNFSPLVQTVLVNFLAVTLFATNALIVNLVLHVFLRGFWIGAIGLRSVQQETDFDSLNYSTFFRDKLKSKVGSLDQLIIRLDVIASVVFAFAFLIVFMFISFFLWVLFVNMTAVLLEIIRDYFEGGFLSTLFSGIRIIFLTVMTISGFIYLIDTLSLGFFKKYKWLSKIYYPIYVFFGWITLSGIYRSIYYSLISRFSKRRIRLLLITFLFILIMYPFNRITFYKYFPDPNSDAKELASNCYDNLREKNARIWSASIPSDIVTGDYLPLFIRYNVDNNETIDSLCTSYTPTKESIWVSGFQRTGIKDPFYKEEDAEQLLACLSQLYSVSVNDSLWTDLDYYFYHHPNMNERGLRVMIDTQQLTKGKNIIDVGYKKLDNKKIMTERRLTRIPFWLE